MSGSSTSLPEKKTPAPSRLINKDRDPEFKTTEALIGTGHQPEGVYNVADRDPGETIKRANTKPEARKDVPQSLNP